MKTSLLVAACGLALSGAASAQVSTGVAGTFGSSGAVSNYGAVAAPTFGVGSEMNASDVRVQGDQKPNLAATLPRSGEQAPPDPRLEPRRDAGQDKQERKADTPAK